MGVGSSGRFIFTFLNNFEIFSLIHPVMKLQITCSSCVQLYIAKIIDVNKIFTTDLDVRNAKTAQ